MSGFKLPVSLASGISPYDPWTTLIVENLSDSPGKLRLDYGTGRTPASGPKTAIYLDVRPQQVDDRTLYEVKGTGQTLAADGLSARLNSVAITVFKTYKNSKPRKTRSGRKTYQPAKMWFRLVACDCDGVSTDEASQELTRRDDGAINGYEALDDDGEEISSSGDSQDPENKLFRILLKRDEAREASLMTFVQMAADQVRTSVEQNKANAEQTRANAEQFDAIAQAMGSLYDAGIKVVSDANDLHLEAAIAKRDSEYATLLATKEPPKGFFETPVGEQVGEMLVGILEQAQDGEKVSDFLAKVGAKTFDLVERFRAQRAAKNAMKPGK